MTYQELRTQIQIHLDANDFKSIVQLITIENVEIVFRCYSISLVQNLQPINDPEALLDRYQSLLSNIQSQTDVNGCLDFFQPENILYAQIGNTYETMLNQAEIVFREIGYPNSLAEAVKEVPPQFAALNIKQREQRNNPC